MDDKPVVPLPNDLPLPTPGLSSRLEDIYGMFIRVTTAPTWTPRSFQESFAIDTANNRFYWYDFTDNAWAYAGNSVAEYDAGNSGTSKTIDWNNGNVQRLTLTGNVTLTFSNLVAGGKYTLIVVQGAGPYTITWPTTAWENGTAPTLTTTNAKRDIFLFIQGASLFGSYAYNF